MKSLFLLGLGAILAVSPAQSKTAATDLKWMAGPPGMPSGTQFAVVSGNPGKAGMFTVRIKMPANYVVPPHHHPADEHLTVLSGKLGFGMGDKLDKGKAKWMSAGGSGTAKANMNHYAFTSAPAEIKMSSMGPFAITYVNPKDDPRH